MSSRLISKALTRSKATALPYISRRSYTSALPVRRGNTSSVLPAAWANFFGYITGSNERSFSHANRVPATFRDALMEEKEAIVVTTIEAPHTILYVNDAWERMCGYTKGEVLDKTLDCIQGVDTNTELADSMIRRLEQEGGDGDNDDEENVVDMYLINYKKNGTPFTNHVSMGVMKLNEMYDDVRFFVGVLEEVQPDQVPLRVISY